MWYILKIKTRKQILYSLKSFWEYLTKFDNYYNPRDRQGCTCLTNEITVEIYDSAGFPEAMKVNKTVQFSNNDYTRTLNTYQYLNAERFVFSKEGKFDLFIREI